MIAFAIVTFLSAIATSEPGHAGRTFQQAFTPAAANHMPPEDWRDQTPMQDGSWWPELATWLRDNSSGSAKPPRMGAKDQSMVEAPGTYIFQR